MSIYLNSASHGLPSHATLERMIRHLQQEISIGATAAADKTREEVENTRHMAAGLINAQADDIGFTSTTTAAWLPLATRTGLQGQRVLVAPHEWGDNIRILQGLARQCQFTLEVLPELNLDNANLESWEARIDEDVAAIFTPMVTSVHGFRYPIETIGRIPRPEGCLLIVDAAQALGQTPVDIEQLGCDALVSTCRKWLRGPKATAMFWTAPTLPDNFRINQLQPVDTSHVLNLGLGNAIHEALDSGIPELQQRIARLTAHAHDEACRMELEHVTIHPPMSGSLAIDFPAPLKERVQTALANKGFVVKFPDKQQCEPCSPDNHANTATLRVSANVYNTKDELSELMHCLMDTLSP